MNYLQDIPDEAKEYGMNKILLVRDLTIDWKHRDTEIFLRNKELLNEVNYPLIKICKRRAKQLRFIYHLSRKVYKELTPSEIVNIPNLRNDFSRLHEYTQIVLDFAILIKDTSILNKISKENLVIFSTKASEKDMFNFFIKKNLEAPSFIRKLEAKDILKLNKNKLISLFIDKNTLNIKERKLLWVLNYYLYLVEGGHIKYQKYKTEETLPKGNLLRFKLKDKGE